MGSQSCLLVLVVVLSCAITTSLAQSCNPSNSNSIATSDITTLVSQLQSGNYDYTDPFTVQPTDWVSLTLNSAMFCTQNYNSGLFDTAQVSLAEVANAATSIDNSCCPGASVCQGGSTTFTGDYGPQLTMILGPSDFSCANF